MRPAPLMGGRVEVQGDQVGFSADENAFASPVEWAMAGAESKIPLPVISIKPMWHDTGQRRPKNERPSTQRKEKTGP